MKPSEQNIPALGLHLGGHFYKEEYQKETDLEKLSRILLGEEHANRMGHAKEVHKAQQEKNIKIISYFEEVYPELLKKIHNPPFVLFCLGELNLLRNRKVSIVGTRHPSTVSLRAAEFIAHDISAKNITTVSGMAHGVDTACHRASYQNKGGTIGVLAHGLDYIYPQSNHDLYQYAQKEENKSLLFISEYPLGVKPRRYHFPRRNRIISGLSDSLFFIEGGEKSGALITCRYALEQGREVYAFDHPLLANNEGGRRLISQGANQLSAHYQVNVKENISSENLLDQIQKKGSFYVGNNLWIFFEAKKTDPTIFISPFADTADNDLKCL